MHITKQQFQPLNKAGIDQDIARFIDKQDLRYQTLTENIVASLHHGKSDTDCEMIEKFYTRLLPVTYRDWICKY